MSFIAPLLVAGAAVFSAILLVFTSLFNAVLGVGTWIYIYLSATLTVITWIGSRRNLSAFLIVGLVVTVIVGPPLVTNSDLILQPIDFIAEGLGRPTLEVLSKLIIVNIRGVYDAVVPSYNTIISYLFERFGMFFDDITGVYNVIAATGDYFLSLEMVEKTWDFVKAFVGYFWMSKSPGGKTEIFQELNPGGHFFEFAVFFTPNKHETDPSFGAFPAVDISGPLYYLRNFLLDFVELLRGAGDIVFRKIGEFAFPGQRFFPSFYLRLEAEASFWRQTADWLTRVISFATGSSFYPKKFSVDALRGQGLNGQSVQPARYSKEIYMARILRIIAQIFRFISLVVIHGTTVKFPLPEATVFGTAVEFITNKLIGVPIVDLFLDPSFTLKNNAVILSKSWYGCDTLATLAISVNCGAITSLCNALGGVFRWTLPFTSPPTCNAAARPCCLWNGLFPPLDNERVDYFLEFYQFIPNIVQLIDDPRGVETTARKDAFRVYVFVITPLLRLVYAIIYYLEAQVYFACDDISCPDRLLAFVFNISIVTILDYVFYPLTCAQGVIGPGTQIEPLTCFITLNSRSVGGAGFWGLLCSVLEAAREVEWKFSTASNFLSTSPRFYRCNSRKRAVASNSFAEKKIQIPFAMEMRLHAMYWSSETRKALTAVNVCVFSQNSTAFATCASDACSVAPCVEHTLDCFADILPPENAWRSLVDTRNGTSVFFRNSLALILNVVDALRGCQDSLPIRIYNALRVTVDTVRRFVGKWALLTTDYVPAYFHCMQRLRERTHFVSAEDDNMEFARCIGLEPPPPPPPPPSPANQTADNDKVPSEWQRTLDANGVAADSSWCAHWLHASGVVVDDVALNESLSFDHLVYRLCSFQLAFGARAATVRRTTTRPLADFLGGWSGPMALLDSLNSFEHSAWAEAFISAGEAPEPLGELPLRPAPSDALNTLPPSARVERFVNVLQALMPGVEMLGAMMFYFADLHDVVGPADVDVHEKAEMEERLLLHHLGLRAESLRKRAAFRGDATPRTTVDEMRAAESPLVAESEERRRSFANAARQSDSRVAAMQEFGRRLFWAGVYPIATAMQEQNEVPFEFSIERSITHSTTEPILAMRVRHADAATGVVLRDPAHETMWHRLPVSAFGTVLADLRAEFDGQAQQMQLLASASAAYDGLRHALVTRDYYVAGRGNTEGGRAAIRYASVLITELWRIINRRLRVEGLPAFHAASLVVDMFGGREKRLHYLPAWLNGRKAYLRGLGFVDNEVYALYMREEQGKRERALALYAPLSKYGELSDCSLLPVRRARLMRAEAEMRRTARMHELSIDDGTVGLYMQRQRQSSMALLLKRHATFAHRSAFLVRHSLHGNDEALHLIAPHWWSMRTAAAAANTTDARQRFSIAASLQSGDVLGALDELLETLGAAPDTLQTSLVALEAAVIEFTADFSDPLFFENIAMTLSDFWVSIACDVEQDVRIDGNGTYKLTCIPYLWERAFDWYEFFPKTRNLGILGYFEDAGFIRWPTAMIAADCPVQRNPTLQCPVEPPPPIFYQFNDTVRLEDFETLAGEKVDVFPVDTTTVLGNICLTDWCRVSTANRAGCPTFDYCLRNYFSPEHFGFTLGTENLMVWLNDARYVYSVVTSSDAFLSSRFWAMLLLFPMLAFADTFFVPFILFTVPAPAAAYLTAAIFIIIEFFIVQRPENYALLLIYFWVWLETLPVVGWIQWVPYIVHIYQLNYGDGVSFLQPLFDALPAYFPDEILIWLFDLLASFAFLGAETAAMFASWSAAITAAQTMYPATELNNVIALISFWNVELLLIEIVAGGWLLGLVGGAVLYFLNGVIPLLGIFTLLASALAVFLAAIGLADVSESLDELEDETDIRRKRIERVQQQAREDIDASQRRLADLSKRIDSSGGSGGGGER